MLKTAIRAFAPALLTAITVSTSSASAAALYYEPIGSLTLLVNDPSPTTLLHAQVEGGGAFDWVTSAACSSPDGVTILQASPNVPGSCWVLATSRMIGPPLSGDAVQPALVMNTDASTSPYTLVTSSGANVGGTCARNQSSRWGYNMSFSTAYTPQDNTKPQSWFGQESCYLNPGYLRDSMEMYARFMGIGNGAGANDITGYLDAWYVNYDIPNKLARNMRWGAQDYHFQCSYPTIAAGSGCSIDGDMFTIDGEGGQVTSWLSTNVVGHPFDVSGGSGTTAATQLMDSDGLAEIQFRSLAGVPKWQAFTGGAGGSYAFGILDVPLGKYVFFSDLATGSVCIGGCTTTSVGFESNTTFAPHIDATFDLGQSSQRWANAYFDHDIALTGNFGGAAQGTAALAVAGPTNLQSASPTLAAEASFFRAQPGTITITAGFSSERTNRFSSPTLTGAFAVTNAETVTIDGPPILTGSATSTNDTGLHVRSVAVGSGATNAVAGWFDAPSGASNNYALVATGRLIFFSLPTDAGQTDNALCSNTASGIVYTGTGTLGTCLGTSSRRFKHDIRYMAGVAAIPLIDQLKPASWLYNKDHGDGGKKRNYWLVAEDVAKILPQCAPRDREGKPSTADPICVQAFMIKAMQEQDAAMREMRTAYDNLAQRLEKIEAARGTAARAQANPARPSVQRVSAVTAD